VQSTRCASFRVRRVVTHNALAQLSFFQNDSSASVVHDVEINLVKATVLDEVSGKPPAAANPQFNSREDEREPRGARLGTTSTAVRGLFCHMRLRQGLWSGARQVFR